MFVVSLLAASRFGASVLVAAIAFIDETAVAATALLVAIAFVVSPIAALLVAAVNVLLRVYLVRSYRNMLLCLVLTICIEPNESNSAANIWRPAAIRRTESTSFVESEVVDATIVHHPDSEPAWNDRQIERQASATQKDFQHYPVDLLRSFHAASQPCRCDPSTRLLTRTLLR